MSDPKAVLAEHGIDVPDGIDVNVVENSDNTVHITMPQAPAGAGELSDEELSNVAGGGPACPVPGDSISIIDVIAEIADCMQ